MHASVHSLISFQLNFKHLIKNEKILQIISLILLVFTENSLSFTAEEDTKFILRTRGRLFSEADILTFNTKGELANTVFDPSKPTVFHVHGWFENQASEVHLKLGQ